MEEEIKQTMRKNTRIKRPEKLSIWGQSVFIKTHHKSAHLIQIGRMNLEGGAGCILSVGAGKGIPLCQGGRGNLSTSGSCGEGDKLGRCKWGDSK